MRKLLIVILGSFILVALLVWMQNSEIGMILFFDEEPPVNEDISKVIEAQLKPNTPLGEVDNLFRHIPEGGKPLVRLSCSEFSVKECEPNTYVGNFNQGTASAVCNVPTLSYTLKFTSESKLISYSREESFTCL